MMRRQQRKNSRAPTRHGEPAVETRTTVGRFALAGVVLLWMAFPPLGWTLCAWLAPVPWLLIARHPGPLPRWGYWKLYFCGVLFWLAMLQGIRLAHPANYLGLLALSLYLAAYLPGFVGLVRSAVHVARAPLWLAAPVVWTALELVRGYLFTGFSIGLLGHTQSSYPWLIQLADLCGAYGVSGLVMLVAAALTELVPDSSARRRWLPAAFAIVVLAATGVYGGWRLTQKLSDSAAPLRVALLQGTRDKVFEIDPDLDREAFNSTSI
jgi:apolipoprotein N-acyltransferase